MAQFSKYKLGVTNLFTPTKVLAKSTPAVGDEAPKDNHFTVTDLVAAGVPESEVERHIELGNLVGLEGSEVEEKPKPPDAKK